MPLHETNQQMHSRHHLCDALTFFVSWLSVAKSNYPQQQSYTALLPFQESNKLNIRVLCLQPHSRALQASQHFTAMSFKSYNKNAKKRLSFVLRGDFTHLWDGDWPRSAVYILTSLLLLVSFRCCEDSQPHDIFAMCRNVSCFAWLLTTLRNAPLIPTSSVSRIDHADYYPLWLTLVVCPVCQRTLSLGGLRGFTPFRPCPPHRLHRFRWVELLLT